MYSLSVSGQKEGIYMYHLMAAWSFMCPSNSSEKHSNYLMNDNVYMKKKEYGGKTNNNMATTFTHCVFLHASICLFLRCARTSPLAARTQTSFWKERRKTEEKWQSFFIKHIFLQALLPAVFYYINILFFNIYYVYSLFKKKNKEKGKTMKEKHAHGIKRKE